MSIRTTNKVTPSTSKSITLYCDDKSAPPALYPPSVRSFLIPEITLKKQKFWDESWNGGRDTWKNCENYKILMDPREYQLPLNNSFVEYASFSPFFNVASSDEKFMRYRLYTYGGSSIDPFGAPGVPIVGLPAFDQPNVLDGTFVPPPTNLENLNSLALRSMLPKIKEDLSLINSIIELKDFKSLPGLVKRFREIVPFIQGTLKNSKGILHTFRDFIRLPAETYLTYQFAIAPLISDIRGVYASLANYQAQISDLISREGKMQSRHFSYKWAEYPASLVENSTAGLDQPGYILSDPGWQWIQRRTTVTFASEFHAEIQYNYNYTAFQRQHADVLGLLDRLGVNLNAQIIWNALPWSFVVDWILDVNRFLGQYAKVQNMEPVINIHQYLWSIKRKRIIDVAVVCNTTSPYIKTLYQKGSSIRTPKVYESAYRRQVGIPGYSSLTSSGLSLKELSLGAALVSTRGRYQGPRSLPAPKTK
jgi:hypothetical protein